MNDLTQWNDRNHPFSRFREEMGGLMQRFFNDPFFWNDDFIDRRSGFQPKLNVKERPDRYVVEVEVPGMNPQEIDIELHGNRLTIKGERRMEETVNEEGHFHRMESSYGSFQRSFPLPDDANLETITAESKSGVVTIQVPKNEQQQPRKIDIGNVEH
ncbi:MAG TPA: Hsp20/alpha crystallin family protein [Bacillales bacterium]|nr:Hsp20/alpha crystallin family protein [Bacillales bacterium]